MRWARPCRLLSCVRSIRSAPTQTRRCWSGGSGLQRPAVCSVCAGPCWRTRGLATVNNTSTRTSTMIIVRDKYAQGSDDADDDERRRRRNEEMTKTTSFRAEMSALCKTKDRKRRNSRCVCVCVKSSLQLKKPRCVRIERERECLAHFWHSSSAIIHNADGVVASFGPGATHPEFELGIEAELATASGVQSDLFVWRKGPLKSVGSETVLGVPWGVWPLRSRVPFRMMLAGS